jgi:nucleoside phosphorylase/predicted acylesterase/phospholipase RssA
MNATAKRFRVAFSFAGEKRDFVAQVAALLAARFTEAAILYDKYHEAEFARRDLGFYLPDLYHDQSDLVVVVVCRDYQQKEWCGLEWDAIFDLLKKRKNSEVMLCRFDHAMVQGLFSTAGFVELDDKTPEEAATRVLERLALNEGKPRDFYHSDVTPVSEARGVHPKTKLDFLERTSAEGKSTIATHPNTVTTTAIDPTEVSIGIITALPKELVAMKAALLDCREYHLPGQGAGRRYFLGSISSLHGGDHRIALALADMGNNIASARATLLLEHFKSVDAIIMVGIAGGVPSAHKPDDHVRLGDIVVSNKKGVVQYDMVKLSEIRACPIPPSARLIEAVRLLEASELEGNRPWDRHSKSILIQLKKERPSQTSDKLYDSNDPTKKISHPKDPKRLKKLPRVFLGPVASANELLKDPVKRDTLRDRFGVKAVEMEGSGIADATWNQERGYLVVRGICDYCDSHKNDIWQEYAAAVAAGYTKALIESMHPSRVASDRSSTLPIDWEALSRLYQSIRARDNPPAPESNHSPVDPSKEHLVEESLKDAAPQSEPPVGQAPQLASPDTPREPLVDFEEFRRYVPAKLIGREDQTDALSSAWAQAQEDEAGRPLVVAITGMGGAGKSSLVAKWAASLGDQGWPGCDAVLAWSFYSQGTREVASVSADRFLKYALAFFRDPKMAGSSAKAAVKGERLAEVIGQQRTLLILDGLEPLQYPPTVPMAGQLRDTGLSALLQGLAKKNRGLCVVTTRIAVHDLNAFLGGTVREHPLGGLSADAGATLLQKLGVEGDIELMKKLVTDVRGHALTLTLLGSFLKRAYGGNIAKRDQVKLEKADATVQGGHAFRAMEAYEQWLLQGGDEGRREVAILRLMGLFDRPADAVSIQKLRSAIVRDFNEPLVGLSDEDLSLSLFTLEEAHLLTVDRQESGEPKSIDAHPLLREYFAGKISRATRKRAEALLAKGDGGDAEHGDDNAPTSEARPQRDLVFISYNETDRSSRDIIRKVLESDPGIRSRVWDYNDIPGGSDVPKEIARHLAQAKVIVMITSPAYVDPTPGARHFEIDSALEARERNEMDILWIPAKSYKFETPPVGHIMAATGPNPVPLENLRGEKRDNALLSLLSAVRRSLGLPLPTTSDREKSEGVEEPHDRLQNALSLSGGGFRATFFHLGVLAFHFRRGALGKLNIITAVSGGSILAAHAVLHWETLKQDEAGFRTVMAKLVTLARSNVRDRILVRWLWSVGTGWRLLGTAGTRLARSRTGRLVRAYRDFYGEQPLQNLQQPDRPWLALVATDLYNSSRVYFSHDGMRRISIADGARQEPFPQKIELDIAFAVAASSSFPPVFRPLVLDYNVLKVRWDTFKLRLHLQDGGVHDNLGLRALQYIAPPENVALGTIHASYAVNPGDIREPGTGLLADRLRALHLFTQGEQAEIANDIATLAGAKPLITKLGHYVPADQPHLLDTATQTALMSFRTDLDAPTWQELYALMAHGYQVAAMHSRYIDEGDFSAARSLFCAILAESLAEENGSTPQQEMPSIEKIVSDLSAKQLHRCGARPKGRIAFHLVLYLLLLFAVAFSANRYGSLIAAWIYHFANVKAGIDIWQAWYPRFNLEVEKSAPVSLTYDPRQKGLTLTCGLVLTNRGTASDGIERANSDLRSTTDTSRHYVFGDPYIIFKDGPNQIPKNLPIQKDSGKAITCELNAHLTEKLRELFGLHDTRRELIINLFGHGQKEYSTKFVFDFGQDIGPTLFDPSKKEPVTLTFLGSDK